MAVHLRNRSGFCYSKCFVAARIAWNRLSDGSARRSLSRLRPGPCSHCPTPALPSLRSCLLVIVLLQGVPALVFQYGSRIWCIFFRVSKVTAVCSPRAPPRPGAGVGVRVSGGSIHDRASRLRLAPRPRRSGSVRLSASTPLGVACAPL